MSNLQSIKLLISQMAGNENHLTVNTTFVHFMDSLEGGVFLSQLVYWSDKTKRTDGYFYKTYEDWKKEICISKHAIMKNVSKLKDMGVLETKVKKANGNPTLHYMLHYDRLCELIISFLREQTSESLKTNEGKSVDELSLTEITTEITTDYKEEEKGSPNPFKFYQENGFGVLSSYVSDKLSNWIDDLSEGHVIYAMQIAVENNSIRWNYVEKILNDWLNRNLKTIEAVHAARAQFEAQKGGKSNGGNQRNTRQQPSFKDTFGTDVGF